MYQALLIFFPLEPKKQRSKNNNNNNNNNNKITLFIDSKKKIDYLQIQEYEY